ncbi:Anaphase-promoting complex subunit 10 [Glugoides intestinalis]
MEIILSSSKKGYGLAELLSSSTRKFWSTDDVLPHAITISFQKKTYVHSINLLLSYADDDSYTPETVSVHFMNKTVTQSFREPEGEKAIPVCSIVFDMHVLITSNHSDGKDSHVRGLKIMSSPTEQIKYNLPEQCSRAEE